MALSDDGLAGAFPDATSRIVVFVHGLCETDDAWRLLPLRGERIRRRTYGERLQDELSFTPVYLRYNTGLRISENGCALAGLLDNLVAAWPTGVEELVLVGHSMGGLVARSACHYGERDQRRWTDSVRHVFCLGTPHLGADLEKGVNVLGWAFGRLPETRAFASVLNARSVGVKDLRFGSCVEEDWSDCDADEFLRDRCQEVPFLPDANYYFVGATLSAGPLGTMLGDLLVRMPSASGRGNGRGRSIPFAVDNGHELAGLTHFDLLNHPAVYEQMRGWITRVPAHSQEPPRLASGRLQLRRPPWRNVRWTSVRLPSPSRLSRRRRARADGAGLGPGDDLRSRRPGGDRRGGETSVPRAGRTARRAADRGGGPGPWLGGLPGSARLNHSMADS